MPELPEVEVVKCGLENFLQRSSVKGQILLFEFRRKNLRDIIPIQKIKKLEGARLLKIERRAKYLLFRTDKGDFLSHMGMTGSWRQQLVGDLLGLHDHLRIIFSDGEVWTYSDPRRFGVFDILDTQTRQRRLDHLGPEPLSSEFDGQALWRRIGQKNCSIKAAIMDQKIVVGVGNIYASEALFLAGILPKTRARKLGQKRAEIVVEKIKSVLLAAIQAGGSTIADFASAESQSGYFQHQHQVYDRAGLLCRRCAKPIKSAVLAGRSTFWCPGCQS